MRPPPGMSNCCGNAVRSSLSSCVSRVISHPPSHPKNLSRWSHTAPPTFTSLVDLPLTLHKWEGPVPPPFRKGGLGGFRPADR